MPPSRDLGLRQGWIGFADITESSICSKVADLVRDAQDEAVSLIRKGLKA
ncbi:hypothetical protein [uncultured Ruegeria sp.]|nr:hypothetical protein [uncultured Ruegeria sp.]